MAKGIKFILFVAILLNISFAVNISGVEKNTGIEFFDGDWASLLAKAQKENKPIMIDAYAVWCGPCKWMAANVFTDKEVGKFYNKNFISYKFDMEKGEGPQFAQKFGVNAYPTILFLRPDGSLIRKFAGAAQAPDLIERGKRALILFEQNEAAAETAPKKALTDQDWKIATAYLKNAERLCNGLNSAAVDQYTLLYQNWELEKVKAELKEHLNLIEYNYVELAEGQYLEMAAYLHFSVTILQGKEPPAFSELLRHQQSLSLNAVSQQIESDIQLLEDILK